MIRRRLVLSAAGLLAWLPAAAAVLAHEQSRIDKLIRFVETQKDMRFIRNGTEYSCAEAGRFLRGKLEAMGQEVTTAREFIEHIASKSSISGQPYHVKFADGKTMLASRFLGDELKRLEGQPVPG
jgi:NAD(P)H-nitrite reductase large subunit